MPRTLARHMTHAALVALALGTTTLALPLAGCASGPRSGSDAGADRQGTPVTSLRDLNGAWTLQTVRGQSVADAVPADARGPYLEFHEGGRMSGLAGVNRMFGTVDTEAMKAGTMRIGPVGRTMMAGPGPLMQLEEQFINALEATASARVAGDTLRLLDAGGAEVATLRRGASAGRAR